MYYYNFWKLIWSRNTIEAYHPFQVVFLKSKGKLFLKTWNGKLFYHVPKGSVYEAVSSLSLIHTNTRLPILCKLHTPQTSPSENKSQLFPIRLSLCCLSIAQQIVLGAMLSSWGNCQFSKITIWKDTMQKHAAILMHIRDKITELKKVCHLNKIFFEKSTTHRHCYKS